MIIRRMNEMELNTRKVDHLQALAQAFDDMTHGKKSLVNYSEQLCRLLSTMKIYTVKMVSVRDEKVKSY